MHAETAPQETIGRALAEAVARFGDREAFTFADRRLSFHDAAVESDAVAAALLGAGIRRGDRVAVWMANHAGWPALYFGILKIGAVLVPLNTRSVADEVAFGLAKAGVSILFFKREVKGRTDYGDVLLDVINGGRVPKLTTLVDLSEPPMPGTIGLAEFLERGRGISAREVAAAVQTVQPLDEAVVMYTSGTTSAPKGALLSHAGMVHSVRFSSKVMGIGERDVYFSLQPLYHSGGAIGGILRPVVTGCRIVTQPYFEAGVALDAIERERVTVISGHQPHYVEYMNHPSLPQRKLVVERGMVVAPPEIYWMVYEKLGIEGLISGYCMTETHLYGTNTTLDDPREVRFNTNGRPNPGVDLEIRDPEDGTALGIDEDGEIFLRVPYPMLGYLDEPQMTAGVLDADGWYRTGDRGVIRKDGNLILLGRVRDMIRVGGENLSGAEVEAVLLEHPAVKQAAAVAGPDPRLGEVVVAFIEVKPDASVAAAELIEHCRTKLASYKVPRAVHFVTTWPTTGSGKVQKRLLLETIV
jgi:acyl-CoA synthetase (AMP-forming)/AMP-acid ligase II